MICGSLSRRTLLAIWGGASLGLVASACAPGAPPAPTTAPKSSTPAAVATPKSAPTNTAPSKGSFTPARVRVATIEGNLINANWMVGQEMGFFKELGIDLAVQGMNNTRLISSALVSGEADLSDVGDAAVLVADEQGGTFKILGNSYPGLDFVVFSRKDINSVNELEGKTIAVAAPGTFPYVIMQALLAKNKIPEDSVNFVNVGPTPVIYQAVAAGKADAGPSKVTFVPRASRDGIKVLVELWKELPDYVVSTFYTTNKAIKEHGDELARTLAGFAKSFRYVLTPESKALYTKLAQENLKVEKDQAEFQWQFLNDNKGILAPNLEVSPKQIEYLQQINVMVGSQKRVLPFEQVVDLSLQQQAMSLVGKV